MTTRTNAALRPRALCLLIAVLAVLAAAPLAAEHREEISRSFAARDGLVVELENLAGTVTIEGTSGGEVEIAATIVAENQALAEMLDIEFEEHGGRLVVRANYPTDEHTRYHYPGQGSGGSWIFGGGETNTRYLGRKVAVSSSDRRGAVTLWADFSLRLPHGVGADVENTVGDVTARGVDGRLSIDTGSGKVSVEDSSGRLVADTGSGSVEVSNHRGDVSADTGSGDVELRGIRGSVDADTGSGKIELVDVEGDEIVADTGSGGVTLDNVTGELELDTGSGRIEGRDLRVSGRLVADTGSGGVELRGDFSGVDAIEIDTGSGGVVLVGSFPGLDVEISTGSGGIDVDLPDVRVIKKEKDYLEATVGGGGVPVVIDTGSGGVHISG